VLRDAKNVPVIAPDEFFKGANVAAFRALHQ
jgi:hypothetical protein